MHLSVLVQVYYLCSFSLLVTGIPTSAEELSDRAQAPNKRGLNVNSYTGKCYDLSSYNGKRATLGDIQKVADKLNTQKECWLGRTAFDRSPNAWKKATPQVEIGTAKSYLLFAREEVNRQVYEVRYPCYLLANRLRGISNACSSLLKTTEMGILVTMNACDHVKDGVKWEDMPANPPSSAEDSGIVFELMPSGDKHVPDIVWGNPGLSVAHVTIEGQDSGEPVLKMSQYAK